jgi:hypothetical protein
VATCKTGNLPTPPKSRPTLKRVRPKDAGTRIR